MTVLHKGHLFQHDISIRLKEGEVGEDHGETILTKEKVNVVPGSRGKCRE